MTPDSRCFRDVLSCRRKIDVSQICVCYQGALIINIKASVGFVCGSFYLFVYEKHFIRFKMTCFSQLYLHQRDGKSSACVYVGVCVRLRRIRGCTLFLTHAARTSHFFPLKSRRLISSVARTFRTGDRLGIDYFVCFRSVSTSW